MKNRNLAILIILFICNIVYASGIPIHEIISERSFDNIFEYYSSTFNEDLRPYKNHLKSEYILGSVFPDLFRYKDDYETIEKIIHYLIKIYPELDKYLVHDRINEFVSIFGESDIHRYGAHNLLMILENEHYLSPEEDQRYLQYFFVLGIYSHIIEDLYVDLIWQNYLCEKYNGGTYTSPPILLLSAIDYFKDSYEHYNAFSGTETFLDAAVSLDAACGDEIYDMKSIDNLIEEIQNDDIYNIDGELFDEIFQCSEVDYGWWWSLTGDFAQVWAILNNEQSIFYDYWHYDNYVSANSDVKLQTMIMKKMINVIYKYEMTGIFDISEVPSFVFNNLDGNDCFSIKSVWNAQMDNGSNESLKKSLIGQLFDQENLGYINDQSLAAHFIHIPELSIYKVSYSLQSGFNDVFIYDPNQQLTYTSDDSPHYIFAIPSGATYDNVEINIEMFSPVLQSEELYDLLNSKIEINPFGFDMKVDIIGDDIYGNESVITSRTISIDPDELCLLNCANDGRKNISVRISKGDIEDYYSIWIQLSVRMKETDDEYKIFYTQNTNLFYQNQIINFKYREKEGRRHKMQVLTTKYPHNIYGDLWGTGNYKSIENYIGSKCLINNNYINNIVGRIIIDYTNEYNGTNNEFILRVKTPNNYSEIKDITKDEFKQIIMFNDKKIEIVSFEEFPNKIMDIKDGDKIGLLFFTNINKMSQLESILPAEIASDLSRNLIFNNSENWDKNTLSAFTYVFNDEPSPLFNRNFIRLDKSIKRLGEGPITIDLDDKIGPNIKVLEPISTVYRDEFANNIIPVHIYVEDESNVDEIIIKFVKNDNVIRGNYNDIIQGSNSNSVIMINEDSILIDGNGECVDIAFTFYPNQNIAEGKYIVRTTAQDDAEFPNRSSNEQSIYIDMTPPYLTLNDLRERRMSTQKSNYIDYIRVDDNFSNIILSLDNMRLIADYYDGQEWQNGVYYHNFENLQYGTKFINLSLHDLIEDGEYKLKFYLKDFAGNTNIVDYCELIVDNSPPNILFQIQNNLSFTTRNEDYEIQYQTNEYTHGYLIMKNDNDSFAIYDEGNINDEDYVIGDIDNLSITLSSSDVNFYPDGHYTLEMVYEDDLGNRATYETRNVIIDRQFPRINQAIIEQFVISNGNTVKLTCNINENQDTEENYGDIQYRIFKNETLLEEGIIEENESQQGYDVSDNDGNIEFDYEIPEDENARQSLRIEAEDESGNINTVNVAYIVNALGVVITEPDDESTLGNGYYYIKGIATDPNITNSYNFEKYKIHYIANDIRYNDAIEVPIEHMGDSANISNNAVMYDNILARINTTEMLTKSDNIKVIVTAYEEFTEDSLCDTVQIYIDGGSIVPNPSINQFSYVNSNIEYEISGSPCEVDLTILSSNGDIIYKFDADNYYYVKDEFSKLDNNKAYVYKNASGNYVIESMSGCNNITFSLEAANVLSIEGQIREDEGRYTISGEGKIIFFPQSNNNLDGLNDNPIELKSDYYSLFMFDENISGKDAIMKLDGTMSYRYNMVDMMGNDIDPGIYTATLEVYGFSGGFDSKDITFEKQSDLEVNISAEPNEINPYEPGFETSIINVDANESCVLNVSLMSPEGECFVVEESIALSIDNNYQFEFNGKYAGEIIYGEWQIMVEVESIFGGGTLSSSITVYVIADNINVYNGLYIPTSFIDGYLENTPIINSHGLFKFNYFPEGYSIAPKPFSLNISSYGRRFISNPIIIYNEYCTEQNKTLNNYESILLDKSRPNEEITYTNLSDYNDVGQMIIHKKANTKVRVTATIDASKYYDDPNLPEVFEWVCYMDFLINGVKQNEAVWSDDNHTGEASYTFEIEDDATEIIIEGNVDVIFNAVASIKIKLEFYDIEQETEAIHTEEINTIEDIILIGGCKGTEYNVYPIALDESYNQIFKINEFKYGHETEYFYEDILNQPIIINYQHEIILESDNFSDFHFPIENTGIDNFIHQNIQYSDIMELEFIGQNLFRILVNESDFNILFANDNYQDTLTAEYLNNRYQYSEKEVYENSELLKLKKRDDVISDSVCIDDIQINGQVSVDEIDNPECDYLLISPLNAYPSEWDIDDDKKGVRTIPSLPYTDSIDFPAFGLSENRYFNEYYKIDKNQINVDIMTDNITSQNKVFREFSDSTYFIPSNYYFNGRINSIANTEVFDYLCTPDEINSITMEQFDNTNDNSEVAFRISNSDGNKYFNCDAYYIQEPLITILINTTEECLSNVFTLDNEEQTSIAVDESVLQGTDNNLIVNFSIYRPSGEMLYTINEEFEYNEFNEGSISKQYSFDGDVYRVRYEVTGNFLYIQYFSSSGNYINGEAIWSVDLENEYIIDDNFTLPNNYNSIEINYSLNSQDYDKVVDYFGAISENPLFIDNSGQIKEVSTFVRHIQDGINPNEHVIGLEKDNHFDIVSVAPAAIPYEYEVVVNGVYENYTLTGNYKFNDTLGIDLGYELSYGSVIKVNMDYDGYDYLNLSMPTYDYPYRDSIIYIKHTNTNNNDSLWFIFEQDPKALFYTHSYSYRSNPYLNISNWNTELYYPNGDINMDLVPVESISNAYNMDAQDYFSPKLQLRAKPKGFVPVNLDVSAIWDENELDDKYFRMYFRNGDGVVEITDGYTPITQLDGTAHYFECSEYYGDGKLICKLYEYDSNIIPIDNRGPDEDYNYLGIMFKDIKIGDIIADSKPYSNIGLDDWFTENSVTMTPYNRTQAYFNDEFVNSLDYPILSKVHTVYPNQAVLDNASEPYLGGYKCPLISLYPNNIQYENMQFPQIKYYLTQEDMAKLGITDINKDEYFDIYAINKDGDLKPLVTASSYRNNDLVYYILWDYCNVEDGQNAVYFTLLKNDETDPKKPYDIEIVSKTKDGIRIKGKKDSPGETVGFMITDPMESIYEALYWYNERKELNQRNKVINIFDEAIYPDGIDDTLIVYIYSSIIGPDSSFDITIPIDSLFEGHNRIFIGNADAFEFAVYNIERRIKDFEPLTIDSMSGTYSNSVKNCPTEILDLTYTKTPPEIVFTQGYTLPANINYTSDIDTIKFTTTRRANIGLFMYDINGNEIVSKVYQVDENLNEQTYIWNGWINGKPAPCGEYQTVLVAYDENGYVSDQESGYFVIQRGVDVSIVSPVDNDWIAGNQTLEAEIENGEPCLIDWTIEKDNTIFQRYDSIPSYNSKLIYSSVYDDGIYQISADAYNNFGDTGEDDITMKLDNTAPSINFISNPDLYVNGCNVYYRFNNITAQFEITDTFSLIDRIEYYTGEYSYTNDINIDNYILDIPSNQYHGEYVQVFAYDNCNNESGSAEYLFEPDNELPELSLTIGNPKVENNGNIYIADYTPIWINASDELSGIKEIEYGLFNEELERIEWHQYTGNMIYLDYNDNNRETLFYQTYDNVGNHTYKSQVLNFDMTPPVSQLIYSNPSYVSGDNIYLSGSSTITVSATDDMSGVQSITYLLEGNEYTQTGNTVDINLTGISEGSHILTYYATDKAGNIEEQKEFIFILDNTPPVLSIAYNMPEYYGTHQFVTSQSSIDIFAEDISCGVKEVNYDINGIITGTGTGPLTVSLISLDENVYNIMVNAYDNLDNYDELNEEFVVDNSSPVSQITIGLPQYIKGDTTLITSNTPIDLISQDKPDNIPSSGVREINYGYNGINNTVSSSEHTDYINDNDGAYEYNYFAIDNLGNIEQTNTITVELDNTAPDVVISYPYDGIFINQNIDIRGYAKDKNFNRWKLEYKNTDDLTWHIITDWQTTVPIDSMMGTLNASILENGVYAIRLTAEDLVSNVNTCEITVKVGEPNQDLELTGYLKPEGVWGGDYIYIADTQHKRAVKVDIDNTLLLEIKEFQPSDVFVDNRGRIFATDQDSRVYIYTAQGDEIKVIDGHLHPKGIEVRNNKIYVADTYKNRIVIYSINGDLLQTIPVNKHPEGIAVDEQGNIFTCIDESNEIRGYNSSGEEIFRYGVVGHGVGEFVRAVDIDVDARGYLWVCDRNNNRVHMIDWRNELDLFILGERGQQEKFKDGMNKPEGLSIVEENGEVKYIYIADTNNHRILRYNLSEISTDNKVKFASLQNGGLEIEQFLPYPNPTDDVSTIRVVLSQPAELTINVFTLTGKLVYNYNVTGTSGINEVIWTGINTEGIDVLNGVYNIQVIATSGTSSIERWSKIAIIR